MSAVMNTIGVAFAYAVLALFAQNAIFTRGLGVSRLIQLVGDERTSSWWFALLLCVTQTLVAPLAYFAGSQIVDLPYRAQLRPLLYLACVAVVCIFEHAILRAVKGPRSGLLIRILPIAAVNSGVLGTVLVERTQSFTLAQSIGFGLGSGLGYLLAVMLVTEAKRVYFTSPPAQQGHPRSIPRPAHHPDLYRCAGAGHLRLYRPFRDPVS